MLLTGDGNNFKKTICCYMNMGLDSVVSWETGLYRVGNQFLNRAIAVIVSVKEMLRRWRAYSIKNTIESISEVKEDGTVVEVFKTS